MLTVIERLKKLVLDQYGLTLVFHAQNKPSHKNSLTVPLSRLQDKELGLAFEILDFPQGHLSLEFEIKNLITKAMAPYQDLLSQTKGSVPSNVLPIQTHQDFVPIQHKKFSSPKTDLTLSSGRGLLIGMDWPIHIKRLALELHDSLQHNFFVQVDEMPSEFLNRINNLIPSESTTFFVPKINLLTPVQKKSLVMALTNKDFKGWVFIGTNHPLKSLATQINNKELLSHLDYYHLVSPLEGPIQNAHSLKDCAEVLKQPSANRRPDSDLVKSYTIIQLSAGWSPSVH